VSVKPTGLGAFNDLWTTTVSVKTIGLGAFNDLWTTTVSVKTMGLGHLMIYGQLLCQ
jgi:hypothetical protein